LRNENEWREVCAMMMLGYARVSTSEQDTAAQVSALKSAACEKIFREKASGGRWDRPELIRLLDQLRKGDVLIVSRLDRLSRSLRDLLMIMERIGVAEAGFRSLSEAIDTTTAPGRMMMQMVGAFAEFERANWTPPVIMAELEVVVQNSGPINRMKSYQWCQPGPKPPLMPRGFSMFIQRRCRGFWLELVPGLSGEGVMHFRAGSSCPAGPKARQLELADYGFDAHAARCVVRNIRLHSSLGFKRKCTFI
jgi:hypothetical protein